MFANKWIFIAICLLINYSEVSAQTINISTDLIEVSISSKGAELRNLIYKGSEYMWQGQDGVWGGTSPVLFPVIGPTLNGEYVHEDKTYKMPFHGFALTSSFRTVEKSENSVTLRLESDSSTLKVYPFEFVFEVNYTIINKKLLVTFFVENPADVNLPFELGFHPGFNCNGGLTNCHVSFSEGPLLYRSPLNDNGKMERFKTVFPYTNKKIPLFPELFKDRAVILSPVPKGAINLVHQDSTFLRLTMDQPSHLALWSQNDPKAEFICVEPWLGHSDYYNSTSEFSKKDDMVNLPPKSSYTYRYGMEVQ